VDGPENNYVYLLFREGARSKRPGVYPTPSLHPKSDPMAKNSKMMWPGYLA
jgi:hypothetical protein